MIVTNQISPELKSAIGQAYLYAAIGESQDRVNYTSLLLTLLGTAVQITNDKHGMQKVNDAKDAFLPAIHDLKHEFTSPDAMVKCMNTLIFVGPMIFQEGYGEIQNINAIRMPASPPPKSNQDNSVVIP